jgi:D-cysteine desulfhydrase family pyridoxal phosphate-dependent enzyme
VKLLAKKSPVLEKIQWRRISFAGFPTPLQRMPNLSKILGGPDLFIKRDDMTDLAFGGNKARKLEFVFADAKEKGTDVVIAAGMAQSNCVCMVASAARRLGMKPVLVLQGKEPEVYDGNLLLDKLLSAEIRFVDDIVSNVSGKLAAVADEFREKGYNPYIISVGATTPLSAFGYALAMEELVNQFGELGENLDYVVCACGTGGTQAGLILGTKLLSVETRILGASVFADKAVASKQIAQLVNGSAELLGIDYSVSAEEVTVFDEYIKEGYGVLNEEVTEALKFVAETEGIFLDPVYTGKAMVALVDLIKKDYFGEEDNIVFLHTGGLPALFPYRKELAKT